MGVATTIGTGGDGNGGDTNSAALFDIDFVVVGFVFRRRADVLRFDWDVGNEIRIERRVDTCLFSVGILPGCEGPAPAAAAAGGGFVTRVVKLTLLGQKVSTQSFAVVLWLWRCCRRRRCCCRREEDDNNDGVYVSTGLIIYRSEVSLGLLRFVLSILTFFNFKVQYELPGSYFILNSTVKST